MRRNKAYYRWQRRRAIHHKAWIVRYAWKEDSPLFWTPSRIGALSKGKFIVPAGCAAGSPTMNSPERTNENKKPIGSNWRRWQMKTLIPIRKQTKRQQKAYYAQKRNTWGSVNPISRMIESKKVYNRNMNKKLERKAQMDS